MNEFYGDGTALPEMHPDPITNRDVLIAALCAKLDTARAALGRAMDMNVITPAAVSMKSAVRHALDETHPATIGEQHCNHG